MFKRLISTFLLLFICIGSSKAGFAELFNFNFKKEYNNNHYIPRSNAEVETIGFIKNTAKPELNFSVAGNINLYLQKEDKINYPLIEDSVKSEIFETAKITENPFLQALDPQAKDIILRQSIKEAPENGPILYKESLLLFQEFLSAQLEAFQASKLDLVFFTGNQVYSNNQIDHFYSNITESFDKYQIPHYEVMGYNEARGYKDIKKEMGDLYYLLQTKKTNFIILNNLTKEVVPNDLPYMADEQYLWLIKILDKLEKENFGEDLFIITYKEPAKKLIDLITSHNHLNLIAFIYGEDYEYREQQWNNVFFISSPSLSKYPCSYLRVSRDIQSNYTFEEVKLNLPQIQDLAKSRLETVSPKV